MDKLGYADWVMTSNLQVIKQWEQGVPQLHSRVHIISGLKKTKTFKKSQEKIWASQKNQRVKSV